MHPYPGPVKKKLILNTSKSALHTKAMVFDRKDVFIGSFNLDPRSGELNTEAGLYVESPEIASQVVSYMDQGVLPENSYRVQIKDGALRWISEREGIQLIDHVDPGSSLWQRILVAVISLFPIEDQL